MQTTWCILLLFAGGGGESDSQKKAPRRNAAAGWGSTSAIEGSNPLNPLNRLDAQHAGPLRRGAGDLDRCLTCAGFSFLCASRKKPAGILGTPPNWGSRNGKGRLKCPGTNWVGSRFRETPNLRRAFRRLLQGFQGMESDSLHRLRR